MGGTRTAGRSARKYGARRRYRGREGSSRAVRAGSVSVGEATDACAAARSAPAVSVMRLRSAYCRACTAEGRGDDLRGAKPLTRTFRQLCTQATDLNVGLNAFFIENQTIGMGQHTLHLAAEHPFRCRLPKRSRR